jgi:hypothetical protein
LHQRCAAATVQFVNLMICSFSSFFVTGKMASIKMWDVADFKYEFCVDGVLLK